MPCLPYSLFKWFPRLPFSIWPMKHRHNALEWMLAFCLTKLSGCSFCTFLKEKHKKKRESEIYLVKYKNEVKNFYLSHLSLCHVCKKKLRSASWDPGVKWWRKPDGQSSFMLLLPRMPICMIKWEIPSITKHCCRELRTGSPSQEWPSHRRNTWQKQLKEELILFHFKELNLWILGLQTRIEWHGSRDWWQRLAFTFQ